MYIAHSYPYTTEKLLKFIQEKREKYRTVVTRVSVGKTLSKRTIEGLVITHSMNKKRDNRKALFIMARQHPGECQGSYVC